MELARIIEAALLVASEPLDVERLRALAPAGQTASREDVLRASDGQLIRTIETISPSTLAMVDA